MINNLETPLLHVSSAQIKKWLCVYMREMCVLLGTCTLGNLVSPFPFTNYRNQVSGLHDR